MAEPLCSYFGKCNGCTLQHIDYETQLKNKKDALAKAINLNEIKVFSSEPYNYRNKVEFLFSPTGLGLRDKDGRIMQIDTCAIADEKINILLKEAAEFFKSPDYFNPRNNTGTLIYVTIRTSQLNSAMVFVLNQDSLRIGKAVEMIQEFAGITTAENVIIGYTSPETQSKECEEFFVVKGQENLKEKYLNKEFAYSALGFFQNNHAIAEKMHEHCHELLKSYKTNNAHLLDLYAGVGCFSIANANLFKGTTLIESFKNCIDAAELNIKNNKITNTKAILLDAKRLKKVSFSGELFVISDPPRSGMDPNTIEQLKKLKPKVMIYISCNLDQLRKDIPKFKDHYVKSAALFDMFPQTNHIEGCVELAAKE